MVLSTTFALAQCHERRGEREVYNDNTDNMYACQLCKREEERQLTILISHSLERSLAELVYDSYQLTVIWRQSRVIA